MEWELFWQIVLLMLVFWLVVNGIIRAYFEQVAMCEVVVGTQLSEAEAERQSLYKGAARS